MSNALSRAYREASVTVRTTAEKNGISLTGRDVDKVVRSYGLGNSDRTPIGRDLAIVNKAMENLRNDAESGELLVNCQIQRERSGLSALSHTTYDDIDKLQRFARMHNNVELNEIQAEAILRSHEGLLKQSSSRISSAIESFQVANAMKIGSKALLRTSTAVTGVIKSSTQEDGTGLDNDLPLSQGYDLIKEQRRKSIQLRNLQIRRFEEKERLARETREAAEARSLPGHKTAAPSPRQNATVQATRNVTSGSRIGSGAANIGELQQARAAKQAANTNNIRKRNVVNNLIRKKKAKEASREGAKQGVRTALKRWAEKDGSSVAAAGWKYILIALLVMVIITPVLGIILLFVANTFMQNSLHGDWYDSNEYVSSNFVEITQDLQRKYYNDCLMLAYKYGADTPTYDDVKINWDEVYSLWSVIVQYRSGNEKMAKVISDTTGYSIGAPVFSLKSNGNMFSSGDDTLQDFYLAFYSMYYDMKALDSQGNPIVIDSLTGDKYFPYYPEKGGSGYEYDYSYFNSENGYPYSCDGGKTIRIGLVGQNENHEWEIVEAQKSHYYFSWASTASDGMSGNGYLNRGLPKVKITSSDYTETFTPDVPEATVWLRLNWTGDGNSKVKSGYVSFSSSKTWYDAPEGGRWSVDAVYQNYGGSDVIVYGEARTYALDNFCNNIYISWSDLKSSSAYTNCSLCTQSYTFGSSIPHSHSGAFWIQTNGSMEVYGYDATPVSQTSTNTVITYPSPTALDGLNALHSVYKKVYLDGWYNTYHQGNFTLSSFRLLSDQRVIEAGTTENSSNEGILVVLDQIFDRSHYLPWNVAKARWNEKYPEDLFAYGLPGASSGSHDCYDSIVSRLNGIRSSATTNSVEGITIPPENVLHAEIDDSSNSKIDGYSSIFDMMVKSIVNVQNGFPFKVMKDPNEPSWTCNSITEDDADAYDVLSDSTYKQNITWNSTTYLMYRYLTCSHGLCPAAACGVLGALQLECGFSTSGYKSITRDNNDAYALGILQWNDGVEYRSDYTNLYSVPLCYWCRDNGYYWRNAGSQLRFLDYCIEVGSPSSGNYGPGVQACQNVGSVAYPDFGDSSYTDTFGMPTYTAADSAVVYEACYYWGRYIEISVEAVGGKYYSRSCEGYRSTVSEMFYDDREHPDITKQRMVAGHIFLRYIAASDPAYYSVVVYTNPDEYVEG